MNSAPNKGRACWPNGPLRDDLHADDKLPDDTRLWAALQRASGGTWGGCVYDVERIERLLAAGERALGEEEGR